MTSISLSIVNYKILVLQTQKKIKLLLLLVLEKEDYAMLLILGNDGLFFFAILLNEL